MLTFSTVRIMESKHFFIVPLSFHLLASSAPAHMCSLTWAWFLPVHPQENHITLSLYSSQTSLYIEVRTIDIIQSPSHPIPSSVWKEKLRDLSGNVLQVRANWEPFHLSGTSCSEYFVLWTFHRCFQYFISSLF